MDWARPGSQWISHLAIVLFGFTTILSAAVVAERCLVFLAGARWRLAFRCCWCAALVLLAPIGGSGLWLIAELLEALVVLPNLLSLLLLSPLLFTWFAEAVPRMGRTSTTPSTPPSGSTA
jgi:AGCS family alanine or glycine:cation symporter